MRGSLLILSTHKDKMKTSTIREERNITAKKIMIREERTNTIKENSTIMTKKVLIIIIILTYNWLCPNVDLVCRMISEGDLLCPSVTFSV